MKHADAVLLQCHDRPGPRYTSYPGEGTFHSGFDEHHYLRHLKRAGAGGTPLSLYTHLPFCAERCLYCAFTTVVTRQMDLALAYLERLRHEIAMVASGLGGRRRVAQLYWGGGTPTYFAPETLLELMAVYQEHFEILPGADIAVEIDPRVTTPAHLEALREAGFKRLSVGIQDFDPLVQATARRVQSAEGAASLVELSRELGYKIVGIDLVYGLPFQSVGAFRETVKQVVALEPERLAIYPFVFMPREKPHQNLLPEEAMPAGLVKFELIAAAREELAGAGYLELGMDHYAREDDELCIAQRQRRLSRNFMGYTAANAPDTIGLGASATGFVGGALVQNARKLSQYDEAVDGGRLPVERGYALSEDDLVRQHVIRELLSNLVLDKREVESRYGLDFDRYFAAELGEIARLAAEGFVELSDHVVTVSALGRPFVRNLAIVFDRYLREPSPLEPTSARAV
jgi:oxygen-independent coproporphyrinogen III oxidase